MTVQTINIGNVVNDGLGDDLRTAFQKVNANFSELQSVLTVTASNVGSGFGIFAQKVGSDLQFKTLVTGRKIVMESFIDSIRINNSDPDGFTRIDTDQGFITAALPNEDQGDIRQHITIQGGKNLAVTATNRVITVDTKLDIGKILIDYDFGPISTNYTSTVQLSLAAANIDFGTVELPGRINLDLGKLNFSSTEYN